MSAATTQAPVTTAPSGTGTTVVPTLPTGHAVGDEIRIWVVNSGVTAWSAPAGWTIKRQQASSGNASTGVIGTLLFRKIVAGDTLPLASPTCTLGATVTRSAVAFIVRGADLEGVHVLQEWLAFASNAGTSNPIRPTTVTTLAPEMLVHIYYGSRSATTAPEQTNYTQVQQVINSGIIVNNVSERTISDQNTALSNQDASPTSGARWIAIISCTPSPDYPYYRSGSQAFNSNATNVTPSLPTGTSSNDNRGNKDLVVLTAQCAGVAPTVNTPAHWTLIAEWSNTTSGGVTTVRKWRAVYTGTLDRQVNRTPSGEIFAYLSVYHNAHQTIPVGTSAVQQNGSSTTSTFPSLPRTGTKATIQATCVADATPTFTAPSGYTERNDSQGVTCADQSFNATGTTASASFTLSSASPTLAGLMEVFSVASVINLILTPATATLTLTSFAPTIDIDVTVTPGAASLSLTTFAPAIIIPADFPFTGLLDNFNRADGGLGANWDEKLFDGDDVLTIDTNLVKGANGGINNSQGWATQLGPDVEVFIEIVSGSGNQVLLAVRWTALDTGTPDGYAVRSRGGAVDNVVLFRFDNGSPIGLATIPQEVDDGDWLGLRIVGDVLTVYYIDISVSPNWVLIGEETDATYSAAGHVGILLESDAGRVDNFSGGTIGDITIEPVTATVTLTTFAPQLAEEVTVPAASLTVATFAPVVSIDVLVTPATASLTLTTFAPTLQLSIVPTPATLTAVTFVPQLHELLTPASTSLTLTTFAPSVTIAVTVPTASLTLTTFAPTVTATAHITVTPANASLVLTRFAPTLTTTVTPASQLLNLTTSTPTLALAVTPVPANLLLTSTVPVLREVLNVGAVSLVLSTFTPTVTVTANEIVTPTAAALALTGFAPTITISADITVTPTATTLTLTGFAPTLHERLTPATNTLSLTTFIPTVTVSGNVTVTPAQAVLTLTTFAPVVTTGAVTTITPASITLTLTSYAPWLFLGLVPANRTFMVESGTYEVEVSAGDYEFVNDYEDSEVLVS